MDEPFRGIWEQVSQYGALMHRVFLLLLLLFHLYRSASQAEVILTAFIPARIILTL